MCIVFCFFRFYYQGQIINLLNFILFISAIHKERALLHRKDIKPLTDLERDNHLFRIPDDPKRFGSLPELTLGPESPGLFPPDQAQASHASLNKSIVDALNSQTNIMSESPAIPKQNNSQLETVVQ